jgi:GntR family transcriptional repressor for pyruvate dehydrogenase complex
VDYVRPLIESGALKPGDRLPPERELALKLGVSRPSLRSGLRMLQTLGIIQARRGAGTFVSQGPPRLATGPLRFLAALHGIGRDEMFEARRVLEVAAAGLAAQRARPEHVATMAEEVASMFASLDAPKDYLVHDVQFHHAVAAGARNRVVEALVDAVAQLVYEERRSTVERATDLRESAEMHRRIYRAIRAGDAERARREMDDHLELARQAQAREEQARPGAAAGPAEPARPRRGRS